MAILTIDEVLDSNDLQQETLFVPEWGGEIVLRGMTRGEAFAARKAALKDGDTADMLVYDMMVLLHGVVEPKLTKSHFDKLKGKSAGAIERITSRIMQLSSVTAAGNVSQKAVDEAEKSFREGDE